MASLKKTEIHKAQLEQHVKSLNEELVSLRARGEGNSLIEQSVNFRCTVQPHYDTLFVEEKRCGAFWTKIFVLFFTTGGCTVLLVTVLLEYILSLQILLCKLSESH